MSITTNADATFALSLDRNLLKRTFAQDSIAYRVENSVHEVVVEHRFAAEHPEEVERAVADNVRLIILAWRTMLPNAASGISKLNLRATASVAVPDGTMKGSLGYDIVERIVEQVRSNTISTAVTGEIMDGASKAWLQLTRKPEEVVRSVEVLEDRPAGAGAGSRAGDAAGRAPKSEARRAEQGSESRPPQHTAFTAEQSPEEMNDEEDDAQDGTPDWTFAQGKGKGKSRGHKLKWQER